MPAESAESKRARLETYLASSRRLHRRVRIGMALGIPIGIAMAIAGLPGIIWGMWLAVDIAGGIAGLWITFGHALDFEHQLKQLAGGDSSKKRPSL